MLVKYKYRNTKGKHGWYQCDCADFKKMWRNKVFRRDLNWCVVQFAENKFEVWSSACNRWYSSKKKWWFA